ncbi:FMN-binding negative transcriptional regulator [Enterovibrio sp. ZSDZ42]|uniref:FMN-binding negative transcriptional regulator n=1 Tax=Enterovibrio gelatinilyticus TaxID=2899819 RepID=A0ABT5R7Z5_9GAMM|nr:FMN-binding negative transcriptional regulator [Enterovibrio sp. ZSDZ42]MDD1796393.1 FMN-binding negative transcriptional regulator [Enterovibrio sp. ZSDZ42]
MFIPAKFKQDNIDEIISVMCDYPFATLVAQIGAGIEVVHLPVSVESTENGIVLKSHIAKANPFWNMVEEHSKVLVIFNGAHSYISPSYYPTKAKHGRAVPTWNYVVVHAKGDIKYVHEPQAVYQILETLTDEQEAQFDFPWSISDAPSDFIEKLQTAVVGIEVQVGSLEGKWKVSQNQPDENIQGIIDGLKMSTNPMASEMVSLIRQCSKSMLTSK